MHASSEVPPPLRSREAQVRPERTEDIPTDTATSPDSKEINRKQDLPSTTAAGATCQESELTQTQIRIQDKIYDAEKLATFHPGGPLFISAFAGRDASQVILP